MRGVLRHMTSYYNRWFGGVTGEESAQWLHDHIAQIIADAPFHTHISLEYFTHRFPQPSIIARFEPRVRNFSDPLTILGAHQDSANVSNIRCSLLPLAAQITRIVLSFFFVSVIPARGCSRT